MRRRIAAVVVAVGAIALTGCGIAPQSAAQKAAYTKCVYQMSGQQLLATGNAEVLPTAKKLIAWWAAYDKQTRARLIDACLRHPNP